MTTHRLHLVDLLGSADVHTSGPGHVELQQLEVGGERAHALFQHPPSTVRVALPPGFPGGILRSACGVATRVWPHLRGPVEFRVGVASDGRSRWLHRARLDPGRDPDDRAWAPFEVDVTAGEAIVFETDTRQPGHAWVGWADPVLTWTGPSTPRRTRRRQPNVLFLTSDASRTDPVGPPIPAGDVLAIDGLRCTDARTVTTTSVGSLVSLMTGVHALRHGCLSDWGDPPAPLPTLAGELRRAGYRTAAALSQQVMARPATLLLRDFDELLPCLTNPTQPGPVVSRQVVRWLSAVPDDKPWFVWASYFDAHPPIRGDAAEVARFYEGDPRDPARAHHPELVQSLRANEALLAIDGGLPALQRGDVDPGLAHMLGATGRALASVVEQGPDLGRQLVAFGPSSRRGLDVPAFGAWLEQQARALVAGRVDPELVRWLLEDVRPLMLEEERHAMDTLVGVVDQRYVLAQCRAGAAQVETHVGTLLAFLRDAGWYDDTTIVYCAPHVEVVEGRSHVDHHASLSDAFVQVPLVIKPGRDRATARGDVDGPIETVDVMPTVLDALGLTVPDVDGTSRWREVCAGRPVPDHDTFAVSYDGALVSITAGGHTLTKALAAYGDGIGLVPAGTVEHIERRAGVDVPSDDAAMRAALRDRLERWLASARPASRQVQGRPARSDP